MKTTKIYDADIAALKVSSLPSRPTAPKGFGGMGYTASDVKAAFDKLPLFIIDRLNLLIEDILSTGADSLAGAISTELSDGHTLAKLFADVKSGAFSEYLSLGDESLAQYKERIAEELYNIAKDIEEAYRLINDRSVDGGTPYQRFNLTKGGEANA